MSGLDLAALLNEYLVVLHLEKKSGATRQWTDDRLQQLSTDFLVVKAQHPEKSDAQVCALLRKRFDGRYAEWDAKTIRRKLQDARNPATNSRLAAALSDPRTEFSLEDLIFGVVHYEFDKDGNCVEEQRYYPPRGRRKS
jgi:hypothetical protein